MLFDFLIEKLPQNAWKVVSHLLQIFDNLTFKIVNYVNNNLRKYILVFLLNFFIYKNDEVNN